jgi:ATP-dependent RNA helicase DDX56/DBP9
MANGIVVTSTQRETTESLASSSKKRKMSSPTPTSSRKRKQRKGRDKEYGVTRGVDFVDVTCVLNFDLPSSARAYTHRVGRTARAGRSGMALSFVIPSDQWGKNKAVGNVPSAKRDEVVFARIEREQAAKGSKVKEYQFDMKQVEAFKYRMEDALRAVTRTAIKEARIKELKTEILNSEKLKVCVFPTFPIASQLMLWMQAHFEDNPLDLEYLRHDKPLHPTRVQPHMKHVPKYLLPQIKPVSAADGGESGLSSQDNVGFVAFRKDSTRGRGRGRGRGGKVVRGGRKKHDPLKKFSR